MEEDWEYFKSQINGFCAEFPRTFKESFGRINPFNFEPWILPLHESRHSSFLEPPILSCNKLPNRKRSKRISVDISFPKWKFPKVSKRHKSSFQKKLILSTPLFLYNTIEPNPVERHETEFQRFPPSNISFELPLSNYRIPLDSNAVDHQSVKFCPPLLRASSIEGCIFQRVEISKIQFPTYINSNLYFCDLPPAPSFLECDEDLQFERFLLEEESSLGYPESLSDLWVEEVQDAPIHFNISEHGFEPPDTKVATLHDRKVPTITVSHQIIINRATLSFLPILRIIENSPIIERDFCEGIPVLIPSPVKAIVIYLHKAKIPESFSTFVKSIQQVDILLPFGDIDRMVLLEVAKFKLKHCHIKILFYQDLAAALAELLIETNNDRLPSLDQELSAHERYLTLINGLNPWQAQLEKMKAPFSIKDCLISDRVGRSC